MIANMLMRFGAILMAMTLATAAAQAAVTFTGEVTYRERIALPPDAQLRITLVSLTDNKAQPIVGADAILAAPGQVPLQFTLNVRSDVLAENGSYGLRAEILTHGQVLFRNAAPVPVDAVVPAPVLIIVNFAAHDTGPATPPAAELDVSAALFDTIWQVRNIAGTDLLANTEVSLSIAPDRRAGGNGGCNNYFTEAGFDGPALSFGPVAGTRMACAPNVMAQETAFFSALENTAGYEIDGDALYLLDADGNQLLRMVRGQ